MSGNPIDDECSPAARLATIRTVLRRSDEMILLARISGLHFLLPHLERVKQEALRLLAIADDRADG